LKPIQPRRGVSSAMPKLTRPPSATNVENGSSHFS
jgi:hypothetical protein